MTEQNLQGTTVARRGETGVARYSPWNEFAEMKRQMDDHFGRAFGYTPLSSLKRNRRLSAANRTVQKAVTELSDRPTKELLAA